jgi:hypothetical protein
MTSGLMPCLLPGNDLSMTSIKHYQHLLPGDDLSIASIKQRLHPRLMSACGPSKRGPAYAEHESTEREKESEVAAAAPGGSFYAPPQARAPRAAA